MASNIKLKNNINSEFTITHEDNQGAISVSSTDLAKVVSVDTIADLRATTKTQPTVWVSGYHTKGDGAFGSNIFEWDATSTEDDNGGTIIKLDSVATGRYKLRYSGAVNVKWFGAKGDGITDDTLAIQNAIDNLSNYTWKGNLKDTYLSNSSVALSFPEGEYLITDTIKTSTMLTFKGVGAYTEGLNLFDNPSYTYKNPKGSALVFDLPTTGMKDIVAIDTVPFDASGNRNIPTTDFILGTDCEYGLGSGNYLRNHSFTLDGMIVRSKNPQNATRPFAGLRCIGAPDSRVINSLIYGFNYGVWCNASWNVVVDGSALFGINGGVYAVRDSHALKVTNSIVSHYYGTGTAEGNIVFNYESDDTYTWYTAGNGGANNIGGVSTGITFKNSYGGYFAGNTVEDWYRIAFTSRGQAEFDNCVSESTTEGVCMSQGDVLIRHCRNFVLNRSEGAYGYHVIDNPSQWSTTGNTASENMIGYHDGTSRFLLINSEYDNAITLPSVGMKVNALDFMLESDVASSSVQNTNLNKFEVGSFVPTISGSTTAGVGTYSQQKGRYQQIGDVVYFEIFLVWSTHTGSGFFQIDLPFTSNSDYRTFEVVANGCTFTNDIKGQIGSSKNFMNIVENISGGNPSFKTIADFSSGYLQVSGSCLV